ncbi:MAG: ATP-dependent RecD-like DNA helicase [Planctomycetota bacterium]
MGSAAKTRTKGGAEGPTELWSGVVERVTFRSEESGYTVLKVFPEEDYEAPPQAADPLTGRLTAVGSAPRVEPGMRVRLGGGWKEHRSHGRQFEFETLEVLPPADTDGLEKYLSSKAFDGVGAVLAARIVEALGPDTLEIIRDQPEKLSGVKGLKADVAANLTEAVRSQLDAHKANAFLRGLGLGPWQTALVLDKYGSEAEDVVRADPYVLAETLRGLGFSTVDAAAQKLGIERHDPRRLRAGLRFALRQASSDGHSLLTESRLLEAAAERLGDRPDPEALRAGIYELEVREDLAIETSIVREQDGTAEKLCYLPWLATSEKRLAENLSGLLRSMDVSALASEADLQAAEERAKIELHANQRSAVLGLLSSRVGILTGGPGVGKTTIVRLVVELAEKSGKTVLLASPTGRAAKRLSEATGRDASTIHRLLSYEPADGGFAHGPGKPLEADLVIVDEISMLDVALAHHLVAAIAAPTRLIFVGDPDQLPSVGPGNVLADMIHSGVVPRFELTQIFRQESGSRIVENAHRILHGERPDLPPKGDLASDFYFFPAEEPEDAARLLVDVVSRRIPKNFGLDWTSDVQVIAPMYRGACGVDALNAALREAQGVGGREVRRGDRIWRTGDRVIHTRNDYEREVFNGDMGRIARVFEDGSLVVEFPDRAPLTYESGGLSDLQPAFAITVHRSQGSEYPCVVLPLTKQHWMMLQRHLLYTAVTRARKLVVLVGSRSALDMTLQNAEQRERESALADRLRAHLAR